MNSPDPNRDDTREVNEREEIARRAYALWEEGGRSEGAAEGYWYAAEQQFRGSGNATGVAPVPGLVAREPIPTDEVSADEPAPQAQQPAPAGAPPRRVRGRTTL